MPSHIVKAASAAAIVALFCAHISLSAATAPSDAVPFSVQDMVRMERLSDVAVAPDGKHVAFTARSTDLEANKGRTSVFLLDTSKRNASPQRLTDSADNSSAAQWSGDGRFVYFLSNRGGSSQVWRASVGGEALQITKLPLDVGTFRVSAKGERLIVSAEVFLDCADLACTKERLDATSHAKATGVLYQSIFIRHWDAWSDGRRSQLFSMPLNADGTAGAPVNVSGGLGDVPGKPFGGREDYAISPDGTTVAFAVRGMQGEPWSTNFDIYLAPADGSAKPKDLTSDNLAWDAQPAFSPDGSQLAYLAQDRPGFEADRFHLALIDLHSLAKHALTQNWDRSITAFAWSRDGKTLYATADHLGQRPLWTVDVASGRASAITGAGEVEGFSVGTNKVFYAMSSLGGPADLYSVGFGGGRASELTHLNQSLLEKRKLGEYTQFSFPGWNGENVFGYLVKPVDFKKDHKYPVAFLIHGGPQGSFGNAWSYRWNPQAFAGAGFAAVMIDFHGSTGYGQAFTDSISGDWGGKPLEDLKAGLETALKQNPWLDADHMCALGGSYGGFMINWIASQWPDRFKCLVSHDGILDQRSMYYGTEELWFPEHEFGGPEYQNPAAYEKFNPVAHVSQWKTPMLVIHGQQDFRVPDTQGIGVFTALQRRGIPSELLYFPNENHWVLKPADSIEWYDTVLKWLNRWTQP
ncbi:MAG TPA: S9 family peptidase [Steroidobacteraceae bacterium]|jgi:dipeptidyl aminopeptidase/acylaminoacyl peptidase